MPWEIQSMAEKEGRQFLHTLYERYMEKLYFVAFGILRNASDAEDIVHETFLELCNNLGKVDRSLNQKTWNYIVTIAKNKSFNLYNKKKRCPLMEEDWEEQEAFGDDLEERVLRKEQQDMLTALVRELHEPYRTVFMLYFYQERSAEEIAVILGKTPDNIRHIAMRARKKLKKALNEKGIN